MIRIMLTACLACIAWCNTAQATLTIIEQDYTLARRTAAQERKLLIIDFYTTWCAPCKVLDKTIFRNDSVAARIGQDFVVLRYDAERDTPHHLSLKHHIASYPTTIVMNADGKLIRKMYGLGSGISLLENYLNLLQESRSLDSQQIYLSGYSPIVDESLYPAFYKRYVRRIADIKPGDLSEYWKDHHPDNEVGFDIFAYFGRAPKEIVDYFLAHKTTFESQFGQADVTFVIANLVSERFSKAIKEKSEAGYKAAIEFAATHLTAREQEIYIQAYELEMNMALGRWDRAASIVKERIRLKKIDENGINYFCWTVYEQCSDQKKIMQALQFMKSVINTKPSYATLDTYARLLAKSGAKADAVTVMKQAIEMGKAGGEDTKDSEAALATF